MSEQRRTFHTTGPVIPSENYFVARTDEINDFLSRIKGGKYIVIFAPRQTGKTSFFYQAMDKLAEDHAYIPIEMDFQIMRRKDGEEFYKEVKLQIEDGLIKRFEKLPVANIEPIKTLIEENPIVNDSLLLRFFRVFHSMMPEKKVVIVIDEFNGIPQEVLANFLYAFRTAYHHKRRGDNYIHSVSIVGVKSISQLDFDRSVSPFKIQDEFALPNFSYGQVEKLLGQYTDEVGQTFEAEVVWLMHEKTAGQPFLVNRLAQILTEELDIPKTEVIRVEHFHQAYSRLLNENNTHFDTLLKNIESGPEFREVLMDIISSEEGIRFNRRNKIIRELVTYGIVKEENGMCIIDNPTYQSVIIDAFNPLRNRFDYLPPDKSFTEFVTSGKIQMESLLENFCNFIERTGYRVLEATPSPREFVGQYLLLGYFDVFVRQIGASIYPEVPTGRGRMDIILIHGREKYIIETKLWYDEKYYQKGKKQLTAYLQHEQVSEGYYVVFDYSEDGKGRKEKETIEQKTILSYRIPVIQKRPTD